MRSTVAVLVALLSVSCAAAQEATSETSGTLKQLLERTPEADMDGDGVLTATEWDAWEVGAIAKKLPGEVRHERVMMPMRDGVKLATDMFIPPGAGKFPVVLMRTPYGRLRTAAYAGRVEEPGIAFVVQDVRGDGDSEGKGTFDPLSFDNEIADGYDTVEWLAGQDWCNGRVGMIGGSGHGMAACMALLANPPHLVAAHPNNSAGNAHLYWTFHNGVRRKMFDWLRSKEVTVRDWPRPTVQPFDPAKWREFVRKQAQECTASFHCDTGWYDIFSESSLDYFAAYAHTGKVSVTVSPRTHGGIKGLDYPAAPKPSGVRARSLMDYLLERNTDMETRSSLVYYLMGDVKDPDAPGNEYRLVHEWPVPNEPTRFYMHRDGSLSRTPPGAAAASLTYRYDPHDPVPTAGGNILDMDNAGPLDQRPLAQREDVLRFVSQPLDEPLAITGKVLAELHISSDVPDTTFMVKLVDIYPDGYQALVRDSAVMARYHSGPTDPAPLKKATVYRLDMDLWSTALVFNKGHRIAVQVQSSNAPKYEVHPNTYEQVTSMEEARVANNTLHFARGAASCIILPVVPVEPE